MKKLLNINQIDEFPFIKRKKEKQLTEKISKRKSSVSISKQKKIDKLRNGRKSLFEPEIIKQVSITLKKFPHIYFFYHIQFDRIYNLNFLNY